MFFFHYKQPHWEKKNQLTDWSNDFPFKFVSSHVCVIAVHDSSYVKLSDDCDSALFFQPSPIFKLLLTCHHALR